MPVCPGCRRLSLCPLFDCKVLSSDQITSSIAPSGALRERGCRREGSDFAGDAQRNTKPPRLLQRKNSLNTSSPNHLSPRILGDDFERRSRLICLVYEVLQSIEMPAKEATDHAMLSALLRAFSDKANAVAKLEGNALEGSDANLPPRHSKPPRRTSIRLIET
jgi:hypothetical protein